MAYRTQIKYTVSQKQEIWDRWQKGESLKSIGRLFDCPSSSIFNILALPGPGTKANECYHDHAALHLVMTAIPCSFDRLRMTGGKSPQPSL